MEGIVKVHYYEKILISRGNIIIKVSKDFLKLTGYTEKELMGKTLAQASKLLKIDSQIILENMEMHQTMFFFTKELVAIEGRLSCETINNGIERVFSFKVDPKDSVNKSFNLVNQFATNQEIGIAIFDFSSLILINGNQNYLDILKPPYNKKTNSIGKSIMEISPKYSDSQFNGIKDHIVTTGTPYYNEEMTICSKTLGYTYWNLNIVPVLEQGMIKYVIVSLSNITEKVLNRKAIEQKYKQLEVIINNISDEVMVFDKEFNIIHSNQTMQGYLHMQNLALRKINNISKSFIVYDENNQVIVEDDFPIQRVARGEIVSNYTIVEKDSLGTAYWEVNGLPIYDEEGNFDVGIMVYRDIKEQMQREESRLIKTQKEILGKVVDALELEFIRCTYPELKIMSINGNGFKSLKESNNGIKSKVCPIGKNYFTIYPIDEETKRKELALNLIKKKAYSYVDYENYMVNGEERFFKTINQPIVGLNNKILEIIFITIDITDEVKARNKMEETLEKQNQIFANISHELKTPLNVIFSANQLIDLSLKGEIDSIEKENMSKNVDIIKQNCFRFTKLINNIIDLSIIESGFYKFNFKNRNIVSVVEDIVDSVRPYVESRGLNIIFDTEIEEKIMAVDSEKKERILLNLISNAVKFSPKGGTIYVEIKDKDDTLEINVRDFGTGIDKKHMNKIFDKYEKVGNSLNRNAEGSGIGLALVKNLVELIGGTISVKSKPGKGALFTVSLPVRVLDETEAITKIRYSERSIEQVNIEFSDIYSK